MKDAIETLHQTFLSEDDIQYLDTAIEMAEELAPLDKSIESTLDNLLEIRSKAIVIPEGLVENNSRINDLYTPDTGHEATTSEMVHSEIPEINEFPPDRMDDDILELFQTFNNMFTATRDRSYLDNALGLVEGLKWIDQSIVADVERLRIARDLLLGLERAKGNIGEYPQSSTYFGNDLEDTGSGNDFGRRNLPDLTLVPADHTDGLLERYISTGGEPEDAASTFMEILLQDKEVKEVLNSVLNSVCKSQLADKGRTNLWYNDCRELESLYEGYRATGDNTLLERAILLSEQIILSAPSPELRLVGHSTMITLLGDASNWVESMENLQKEIECLNECLKQLPQGDPEEAALLATLGVKVWRRYQQSGLASDVEEAIEITERAMNIMPSKYACRTITLKNLARMMSTRYEQTESPEVLTRLLEVAEAVRVEISPDDPDKLKELEDLTTLCAETIGSTYFKSYQLSGSLEDLDKAISNTQKLLMVKSCEGPDHQNIASALGQMFYDRYKTSERVEDLDQALRLILNSAKATALDHPNYAERLYLSSRMLLTKHRQFHRQDDLDQAVHLAREALAATVPGDPHRPIALMSLMESMGERYEYLGAEDDLVEAIKAGEGVISEISPGHLGMAHWLIQLAELVLKRYEKSGLPEDIEQALYCGSKALDCTPLDHEDRPEQLECLGSILFARYKHFENIEDIEQATKKLEEAVMTTPQESPQHEKYLGLLAYYLGVRYKKFPSPDTLQEAINRAEEVTVRIAEDDPRRIHLLNDLGGMYSDRCSQLGDARDLEQSTRIFKEVSANSRLDASELSRALGNHGLAMHFRYYRSGDIKILDEGIELAKKGVEMAPPGQDDLAQQLSNLGAMIQYRYERCGEPSDLEESILYLEKSLALTPQNNSPPPTLLANLSAHFVRRYDRLGALDDLDQAVRFGREAKELSPKKAVHRAIILSTLTAALKERYHRLGLREDLDEAMECGKLAVHEAMECSQISAHPDPSSNSYPSACQNLASIALIRYDRHQAIEDLHLAIKCCKEATERLPRDSVHRNLVLCGLVVVLQRRYMELGDLQDLDDAIKYGEESVALTPRGHARRAEFLIGHSSGVLLRYLKTNATEDFYHALHISYEAWHCHLSPPTDRFKAALAVSRILDLKGMFQEKSSILQDAVRMLPQLSRRSLGRSDQESRLSVFAGLAAEVVSLALQGGEEAMFCLRILEFGRGIITGLIIDCRSDTDLPKLKLMYPENFTKFDRLRKEIDAPILVDCTLPSVGHSWVTQKSSYEQSRRRREQAVYQMEDVLSNIRGLPGFEGFQLPPRSRDLMAMASEGPIIIFNCTALRTDAIIVTSTDIRSLRLSKIDYDYVKGQMSEIPTLVHGTRSTYQQRNERMEELLLWLWEAAVEPVLDSLTLEKSHGDLPRIWWIGVGVLAMAPFHAAGDHSPGSTRNTMSRVISSYIPTMKSLSFARRRELKILSNPDSRLLLVAMPTTPGENNRGSKAPKRPGQLKSVVEEVQGIISAVEGRTSTVSLNCPSADGVLKQLPSCDAVHFACHGVSNRYSPSQSHLILRKDDNTEEGTLDKLTVETISTTNIENAQIAYLSACSTADNSSNLGDECIYIASAFQLAGFSHVLATQWVSNDIACRQVAIQFYRLLFSGGKEGHRQVSISFHHAVKRLRDQNLRQPIKWACYIHTGA